MTAAVASSPSQPWSRIEIAAYVAGWLLVVAMLMFEYITIHDIRARVTIINGKPIEMRGIGVWVPKCDKDHFWGRMLAYRDDTTGDIYTLSGRACWDWSTRSWVVTPDIAYFIHLFGP